MDWLEQFCRGRREWVSEALKGFGTSLTVSEDNDYLAARKTEVWEGIFTGRLVQSVSERWWRVGGEVSPTLMSYRNLGNRTGSSRHEKGQESKHSKVYTLESSLSNTLSLIMLIHSRCNRISPHSNPPKGRATCMPET